MSSKRLKLNLSTDNKVQFWVIFTTALVGLFSFWLGITIQDDINTKNARETQKLARYQMVEAVYPKFAQYIDTGGYVFYDLLEIANTPGIKPVEAVSTYYQEEQIPFIETMKNSVNFMCDNRYYFGKTSQERICRNNISMLFGLRLLERNHRLLHSMLTDWDKNGHLEDSIALELASSYYAKDIFTFRRQAEENLVVECKKFQATVEGSTYSDSLQIAGTAVYQFIFKPYIDNFEVYAQELMPGDDVSSHLWRHLLILLGCIAASLLLCIGVLKFVFGVNLFIINKQ